LISYIDEHWGSGASLPNFAPTKAEDAALQQWWGKFEPGYKDSGSVARQLATPLFEALGAADRALLTLSALFSKSVLDRYFVVNEA
jgi:hypothetical protein